MDISSKISTYREDLEKVQLQIKELQQVEQRLVGAILALQELDEDELVVDDVVDTKKDKSVKS